MLAGLSEGAFELGGPAVRRLPWTRIDEIERKTIECAARNRDRAKRFVRRMQPAELLERGIIKRLHAERNAVHAGRAIAAQARRLDAGRIGFERHLDVGNYRPVLR